MPDGGKRTALRRLSEGKVYVEMKLVYERLIVYCT